MDNNSDYDSDINEEFMQYGGRKPDYEKKFKFNVATVFVLTANKKTSINNKEAVNKEEFKNFFRFNNDNDSDNITLYDYTNRLNKAGMFDLVPGIVKDMYAERIKEILKNNKLKGINAENLNTILTNQSYDSSIDNDKYWQLFIEIPQLNFVISQDLVFIFNQNHNNLERNTISFNDIGSNNLTLINKDLGNEGEEDNILTTIATNISQNLMSKNPTNEELLSSIIIVKGGRKFLNPDTPPAGTTATTLPPTPETQPPETQATTAVTGAEDASELTTAAEAAPAPEEAPEAEAPAPAPAAPLEPAAPAPPAPPAPPAAPAEPNQELPPQETEERTLNAFIENIRAFLTPEQFRKLYQILSRIIGQSGGSHYKLNKSKSKSKKIKRIKKHKKNTKKHKKNTKKHKKKLKNTKKRNVRNTKKR